MDFHMTKVKAFRVRGKLAQPQLGKTTLVMLMPKGSAVTTAIAPRMVRPQPDGSFEFTGVTPGQWVLRAGGETAVSASLDVVAVEDRHTNGLVVALAPPRELAGVITVEGKEGPSPKGVQVTLEGQEANNMGQTMAGDDGKFTVKNLMPDRYRVLISGAPGNTYAKSIRYGAQEVDDDGMDLTGGSPGSIEIRLSPNGAEVGGSVAADDGKPMPGVTVALIPNSHRYPLFQSDTTDQSGAFRFHAVPPGEYQLLAWEDVVSGAWYDPEFLKPFESQALAVSVKENDRPGIVLKSIPGRPGNEGSVGQVLDRVLDLPRPSARLLPP